MFRVVHCRRNLGTSTTLGRRQPPETSGLGSRRIRGVKTGIKTSCGGL